MGPRAPRRLDAGLLSSAARPAEHEQDRDGLVARGDEPRCEADRLAGTAAQDAQTRHASQTKRSETSIPNTPARSGGVATLAPLRPHSTWLTKLSPPPAAATTSSSVRRRRIRIRRRRAPREHSTIGDR
jgi:hypothetical protein